MQIDDRNSWMEMLAQRKVYCFLLLLTGFLWGCDSKYNFFKGEYRYQPYTGEIVSIVAVPTGFDALGATSLWIEDSILVAHFFYDSEVLLSAYSLRTGELLCKNLILKGNGPNEYKYSSFVNSYTNATGSKLWVQVNVNKELLCIDLTESIRKGSIVVKQKIDLWQFDDHSSLLKSFIDSDTSLVLLNVHDNMEVSIGNLHTGQKVFYDWVFSEDALHRSEGMFSSSGYSYNAQKKVFVSDMYYFDQVNFFPLSPEGERFSVSTKPKPLRFRNLIERYPDPNGMPNYYTGGCYTDAYLICKYSGGTNRYERAEADIPEFLHIFNWEGELLKIIALDRSLSGLAIDSRNHTLYGIDAAGDIVKYTLPLID
jgi:hypothetical protein